MAVSLVMIGLFIFVGYMAQQVSNWLRQRVGEVELFIDDRADERTIEMLQQRAGARPGVAEALFVSQEEAREIFRAERSEERRVGKECRARRAGGGQREQGEEVERHETV